MKHADNKGKHPNEIAGGQPGEFCATTTKHITKHISDHDEKKAFSTMQAKFLHVGHTLRRTVNPDQTILYLTGKCGYFRELKGLEAVAAFLAFFGGA